MSLRDRLTRRVMPRVVVRLSTVRWPPRLAARARRALGGEAVVRLYVAFDDPYSAVALVELAERLARRPARIEVEAVVARGIPGDPAAERKRSYAVTDAQRLARRSGRELTRSEPLAASSTAFLAGWAANAPAGHVRTGFCADAMHALWFDGARPVSPDAFAPLWRERVDGEPPASADPARAERRMRARRLYDTPVAVVGGQWFFAHERLDQIEAALDELGWASR